MQRRWCAAVCDIGAYEQQFADCNENGVSDADDLATVGDCDGNGVPDECQADADGDGVIDACEPALAPAPEAAACGCGAATAVLMSLWAMGLTKLARRRRVRQS
ncbi:MAG: hypothetical protein JSU68_01015 [Phycisphaerales bacterium]|nr:MAG: hypothetical protein JSU68_01015 [Phycisphaerales bacterium]